MARSDLQLGGCRDIAVGSGDCVLRTARLDHRSYPGAIVANPGCRKPLAPPVFGRRRAGGDRATEATPVAIDRGQQSPFSTIVCYRRIHRRSVPRDHRSDGARRGAPAGPLAAHWRPTGGPLAAHWRPTGATVQRPAASDRPADCPADPNVGAERMQRRHNSDRQFKRRRRSNSDGPRFFDNAQVRQPSTLRAWKNACAGSRGEWPRCATTGLINPGRAGPIKFIHPRRRRTCRIMIHGAGFRSCDESAVRPPNVFVRSTRRRGKYF